MSFGTWGGLGPEAAKVMSRIVRSCTAWEDAESRGTSQYAIYEQVGVALARQIWKLLASKNFIRTDG